MRATRRYRTGMRLRDLVVMRERATLKLDSRDEVRVPVDRDDLAHDEIVVRRADNGSSAAPSVLLGIVDEHLASAARHPAGTTDRLLSADRLRPY
jgi:hypothetical protein